MREVALLLLVCALAGSIRGEESGPSPAGRIADAMKQMLDANEIAPDKSATGN